MVAQVGAFEVGEPVPELNQPRLLVSLQPWIDVNSVGTLVLSFLEERWGARELGRLARPGEFYDFTRYRPMISHQNGERKVTIPNTVIRYAQRESDWLFVHALEPHAHAEDFRDSLVEVIRRFGVREYWLIGSMYAPVPHTRPPVVSGGATTDAARERLEGIDVRSSSYEGPTTFLATLPEQVRDLDVSTGTMIVQLPAYAQFTADYRGAFALLSKLKALYGLEIDLHGIREQGEDQYSAMDDALAKNPELAGWVQQMEAAYDRLAGATDSGRAEPQLSPELERFLKDLERRFDEGR